MLLHLLIGLIISMESIYFHEISSQNIYLESLEKSDVIIVFAGGPGRIRAGYELANSGYAPYLVVSPATTKKVNKYNKTFCLSPSVSNIIEDKARTTAENAIYARKIILENQFRSVILVTSSVHLPRSCFLLESVLFGTGISIQRYGVIKDTSGKNSQQSPIIRKRIYNEKLKLWGSLAEILTYEAKGNLPEKNPKKNPLIVFIKSLFLF